MSLRRKKKEEGPISPSQFVHTRVGTSEIRRDIPYHSGLISVFIPASCLSHVCLFVHDQVSEQGECTITDSLETTRKEKEET